MSLDNVLFELTHEGAGRLKHVEGVSDRSSPSIEPGTHVHQWDKHELLKEIEGGIDLKHVDQDQAHDRSEPRIEEDVHLQPSNRAAHLKEVKAVGGHHAVVSELKATCEAGGPSLAHVPSPADRSAPAVQGAHVGQWDKGSFLSEIEASKPLKHVEQVNDRSEPVVEPDVQIKHSPHTELMDEIRTSGSQGLKHVEETADRSRPQVCHTAALRVHGDH